jgi:cellobiose phosphorylase
MRRLSVASSEEPLRSELFSVDQLRQHARQLAKGHRLVPAKDPNRLLSRLAANEKLLREYNEQSLRVGNVRRVTPAAEWLLDNFHLIEQQIRMARRHLPRTFSRELPHLASGISANSPRVYDLALELISHVDGRIDASHLTGFIAAYQEIAPLNLGELWAVPIMLRLALIENLRRVAVLLDKARKDRDLADSWVDKMQEVTEQDPSELVVTVGDLAKSRAPMTQAFVTEFSRRVREKSPSLKLALNWMEERLNADGVTIEQLVQNESQSQAAIQVSVGNSITSLRFLDAMNWRQFVEDLSAVEHALRGDPAGIYAGMDFGTRDAYRHIVERIAKKGSLPEKQVATIAVELARARREDTNRRLAHVGYYLLDQGIEDLERAAGLKPSFAARLTRRHLLPLYLGGMLAIAAALTFALIRSARFAAPSPWLLALAGVLALVSASQLAIAFVNWLAIRFVRPGLIPRMDFSGGVPVDRTVMVVVPTLLNSIEGIEGLIEGIEVRYLANRDRNVFFALLTDFPDAPREHMPEDEALLQEARAGIESLNKKYEHEKRTVFYLFHRPRRWNKRDRIWMGLERKRGKLADFNAVLRGRRRESFSEIVGDLAALPHIQYVITLDTDTQLPRDAARQLAGAMAHPLNAPGYDPAGRMVEGYAILQPRVGITLPGANRSRFARVFAGDPGIDPYTRAVSDVYQDLFQEGSFIGKGIYDLDAFERAVGEKFPENRILSHDLLESCYARSGLITDVMLFEEFPTRYLLDARRRHRWMRGDWQIASWLLPRAPGPEAAYVLNSIGTLSRWKIFDNLRRSLVAPSLIGLLLLGWTVFPSLAVLWSLWVTLVIFLPGLLSIYTDLLKKTGELPWRIHFTNVLGNMARNLEQAFLTLMFLPYDAWISADAALRTIGRLTFTRRNLLEWQTAGDAERASKHFLSSHYQTMWMAPALAVLAGAALVVYGFKTLPLAVFFLGMWALAPLGAWAISRPAEKKAAELSAAQKRFLHICARKTWRYFEAFVGPEDHWLPPDNFQEYPRPIIASRTSPTNIGLYLLGTLAGWDFGYLSVRQLSDRIANTLATLEQLEKYQGHLYNWYDTRTLKPLNPLYLSTVDNGNFAGFLLTLRAGLQELSEDPWPTRKIFSGLRDTLHVLLEVSASHPHADGNGIESLFGSLEARLADPPASLLEAYGLLNEAVNAADRLPPRLSAHDDEEFQWWRKSFADLSREHRGEFEVLFPWLKLREQFDAWANSHQPHGKKLLDWWLQLNSFISPREISSHLRRFDEYLQAPPDGSSGAAQPEWLEELKNALHSGFQEAARRAAALQELALRCDELAMMDFSLLFDPSRKLFSVGYSVASHKLDGSYYDLLASEARLASFVAIALGQVPQEHWFALGRLLTAVDGKQALISWSGSMFEYLMPQLVMPIFSRTLLDTSCQAAVTRQIDYGKQLGVPWGISESAYNLTDAQSNYQYRAFGVPGLGFKRGLAEDIVIAPYATSLAIIVAPQAACANLQRLRQEGAEGRFGFYEALDYTGSRLPRGRPHALVQCFMAHHQGMALLSLAHCLLDHPMQRRFQANPFFKTAELLLQERVPRESSILHPHELEAQRSRHVEEAAEAPFRIFRSANTAAPEIHLLSNGHYHVMVTNAGGGYSLWNDTALTRWREDPTRDCWGTFIYFRDTASGRFWSAAHQPTLKAATNYEAIFSQGRAEFRLRLFEIDSHTEIAVSPEDDVEVRRITFTNHSNEPREIEVTSFAEVVLNHPAADQAHPAFNKLFIQTEILRRRNAIVCSRRPRARGEQPPWMFHLVLAPGSESGEASFETDRSRFLGRGRDAASPAAFDTIGPLSNTAGAVLDPAIAIRRTVRIQPKETARIIFVTGCAASREALLHLVEKYQDHSITDRGFELAWTHGLVTLRHLNATEPQAQLFGRLASALLYHAPIRRAPQNVIAQNRRGQRNLWSFGISGDLPIVLVRSTSVDRLQLVREVLQAHAYWRLKGLTVDLVIVNDDDSVYRQSVHDQIMMLISSGIEAQMLNRPGGIFVRRGDQLSPEDHLLLQATARIVLSDENGPLAEQLQRRARPEAAVPLFVPERVRRIESPARPLPQRELKFFNGLGGFAPDGREYVITTASDRTTPMPWVNVIANPEFGTVVSESGGAYTWFGNAHEFRLTPWNNDPVMDLNGEAFYIRDEQSGRYWSPAPLPARGETPYNCRHGFGYTVFEHGEDGISSELWIYVAADAPIKFARLVLRNTSERPRALSVTGYWEWVLGDSRQKNSPHVVTELDQASGGLLARNSFNNDFEGHTAFAAVSETLFSWTCDRTEFIGRNGSLSHPAALGRRRLSGKTGASLDACAALQAGIRLEPGEQHEIIFRFGVSRDRERALSLLQTYRRADACRDAIYMVRAYWNDALGAVEVETPDPALNLLANGWLLYQTLACRMWARTGFYQSGGAFGFRDQLQDAMALVHSRPALLREHLLRAAARQFREGDVQHWWHPPQGRGVRTHFSDDYLWLPFATCRYVEALGDTGVLDEKIPFLEGRALRPEEENYYDSPRPSGETGTLYEHCVRAVRHGLRFGVHGLPLIGGGDWNDAMNLVGEQGKGESVWLAFFLHDVLKHFAVLARNRSDAAFAEQCDAEAKKLADNIEKHAWDGQWYRRAYFDNGDPLGAAGNPECQIDSLPQSWAVLSGVADPERARSAMNAVEQRLVRRQAGLIQLFDPPFDTSSLEPGYIKGYVPGVRENGGQYTHAAIWTAMGFAELGDVKRAWQAFDLLNPIRHALTPAAVARYKVEPYVVTADVYSRPPHTGRGGWSWYTGSAGWLYRLITETFLGLRLAVDKLYFHPRVPADWKSFKVHYRYRETNYHISVFPQSEVLARGQRIVLDGAEQPDAFVRLTDDRRIHQVEVHIDQTPAAIPEPAPAASS